MFANAIHVKMLNGFRQGVSDGSGDHDHEDHDHDDTQITTLDGQINGAGGLLEGASPQTGPVIRRNGNFTIFDKTLWSVWGIFFNVAGDIPSTTKMLGTTNFKVVDKTSDFDAVVDDVASLNTLLPVNANGDTTVGVGKSLLFDAYNFTPIQYKRSMEFTFLPSDTFFDNNRIFSFGSNSTTSDWVEQNSGQGDIKLDHTYAGYYKLTFTQTTFNATVGTLMLSADLPLCQVNDANPHIVHAVSSYSFGHYDANNVSEPPKITLVPGFLNWNVFITFPNTNVSGTANFDIRLTKMPY